MHPAAPVLLLCSQTQTHMYAVDLCGGVHRQSPLQPLVIGMCHCTPGYWLQRARYSAPVGAKCIHKARLAMPFDLVLHKSFMWGQRAAVCRNASRGVPRHPSCCCMPPVCIWEPGGVQVCTKGDFVFFWGVTGHSLIATSGLTNLGFIWRACWRQLCWHMCNVT